MRSYMAALGLLFLALGHPSLAQSTEPAPAPPPAEEDVIFDVRAYLEPLNCSASAGVDPAAGKFSWKKNGTELADVVDLKGRYTLKEGDSVLAFKERSVEDDFGNYTCHVGGELAYTYRLKGRPWARVDEDVSVVEGQKVKIKCRVVGKPYPAVTWTFLPWGAANATAASEALGERVTFDKNEAGVVDAVLVLEPARLSDAGNYTCAPGAGATSSATLRVKDMYAALWPFLGICIEVFILCAIILVYEKRRTKPEHDDSDTDNHEQ